MSRIRKLAMAVALLATTALIAPDVATATTGHSDKPKVTKLASFVDAPCIDDTCALGSTVGPDGALYVTDSSNGRIQRIDPRRGRVTTYANGLPVQLVGAGGGGLQDVAFLGRTAYVLVGGTNEFWTELIGSSAEPVTEGVYRIDRAGSGKTRATLVADIYTWSEANPPLDSNFFVPGGYTYAMEAYGDGFLVTNAHHNRVLRVRKNGQISVFTDFNANVVPTGLDRVGSTVLVGQAGPVPHTAKTGVAVGLRHAGRQVVPLASGAPLLVDVEVGKRDRLYGLAQGDFRDGDPEGAPAQPSTGRLMLADRHGRFRTVVSGLDRPTTFEIIGESAYVVTIDGKVLRVTGHGR